MNDKAIWFLDTMIAAGFPASLKPLISLTLRSDGRINWDWGELIPSQWWYWDVVKEKIDQQWHPLYERILMGQVSPDIGTVSQEMITKAFRKNITTNTNCITCECGAEKVGTTHSEWCPKFLN